MIEKQFAYKYKIYEQLKEDIINGVYPQGHMFNERKLSEELGISRTPIREALQLLQKDGWVRVEAYRGSVVRTFDAKYVKSILKVRKALEVLAVEEATKNIYEKDLEYLQALLEKHEGSYEKYDPIEFMKLDREMHQKIYTLSDNEVLISTMSNINDVVRFLGIKALQEPQRNHSALEEHRDIIKCIGDKNVAESKKAMEKHMDNTFIYTMNRWISILDNAH